MKNTLLFICILCLFSSCENKQEGFVHIFKTKENIRLNELHGSFLDSLGRPETILSYGNNLFFVEPILPELLLRYDFEKESISHLLPKGQGANEATYIQTIGKGRNSDEIFACDPLTRTIHFISLTNGKTVKDSMLLPNQFCDVAYDKNLAFFLTVGSPKRFGLRKDNKIIPFGENVPLKELNTKVVSKMLQGPCLLSAENKRIVWFSIYGDIMEIYDYNNIDNIALVKSCVARLPSYNHSNGAMSTETVMGVQSVTTDDTYIYALYSGQTLKEMMKEEESAIFTNTIFVFDWNGNPIKNITLNMPVRSITYDKKSNRILGLGLDNDFDNTIYDIPIQI